MTKKTTAYQAKCKQCAKFVNYYDVLLPMDFVKPKNIIPRTVTCTCGEHTEDYIFPDEFSKVS